MGPLSEGQVAAANADGVRYGLPPSARKGRRGWRRTSAMTVTSGFGLAFALGAGLVSTAGAINLEGLAPAFVSAHARALARTSPDETVLVKARVENSTRCGLVILRPSDAEKRSRTRWRSCASGRFAERIRFGPSAVASTHVAKLRLLARSSFGDVVSRDLTVDLRVQQTTRSGSLNVSAATPTRQESTNWAGYVSTLESAATAVSATWSVPSVTCGAETTWLGSWLGVDGAEVSGPGSKALFQVGIYSYCVDGHQQNEAWWEAYPGPANPIASVTAGDTISAAVLKTTGGWMWSISDTTTDASYQSTGPVDYSGPAGTAEWIVEDPGAPSEPFVTGFSPITFTNMAISTVGRRPFAGGSTWQMVQNGRALATPDQSATVIASRDAMTVRSGGNPY
jgi:hypothetical protein